jgi:hypothetical protein
MAEPRSLKLKKAFGKMAAQVAEDARIGMDEELKEDLARRFKNILLKYKLESKLSLLDALAAAEPGIPVDMGDPACVKEVFESHTSDPKRRMYEELLRIKQELEQEIYEVDALLYSTEQESTRETELIKEWVDFLGKKITKIRH